MPDIEVKWDYTCPCYKEQSEVPEDREDCSLKCSNCGARLRCDHKFDKFGVVAVTSWLVPDIRLVN